MSARSVRYSTLLWPALWSRRRIVTFTSASLFLILTLSYLAHLGLKENATLKARTTERAAASLQLKLSGVEPWNWQQNFACTNGAPDCLRVSLHFAAPNQNAARHKQEVIAPTACAICHAKELAHDKTVVVVFPDIPAQGLNMWLAYALAVALFGIFIYVFSRLAMLRRHGRAAGICVAAVRTTDDAPAEVTRWLAHSLRSPFAAYFTESEERRTRWITTTDKFTRWLASESHALMKHRKHLRLVALHGNLSQVPPLPVELLRYAYRFLSLKQSHEFLLHADLKPYKEESAINKRRLVLKNKSGASLIFVVWEPD